MRRTGCFEVRSVGTIWQTVAFFSCGTVELTIQRLRSTKCQLSGIFRITVVRPWWDSIGSIPSCSETGLPECQWKLVVMGWEGLPCGTGMPWGFARLAGQDDVQSVAAGKTDHCLVWEFGNSEVQCLFGKKLWELLYSCTKPWHESTTSRHEEAIFYNMQGWRPLSTRILWNIFPSFWARCLPGRSARSQGLMECLELIGSIWFKIR